MKQHCLKKNFLWQLEYRRNYRCRLQYGKRVCKDFEIKNLEKYHDLYLFANVFENFRNTCVRIYELDSAKCLSAPGLVWQAASKKTEVKLELLTDVDMLLMVEKGIRGGICHVIYKYEEANSKYMKDYDTNKKSTLLGCNYMDGYCLKPFQKINSNG